MSENPVEYSVAIFLLLLLLLFLWAALMGNYLYQRLSGASRDRTEILEFLKSEGLRPSKIRSQSQLRFWRLLFKGFGLTIGTYQRIYRVDAVAPDGQAWRLYLVCGSWWTGFNTGRAAVLERKAVERRPEDGWSLSGPA